MLISSEDIEVSEGTDKGETVYNYFKSARACVKIEGKRYVVYFYLVMMPVQSETTAQQLPVESRG